MSLAEREVDDPLANGITEITMSRTLKDRFLMEVAKCINNARALAGHEGEADQDIMAMM